MPKQTKTKATAETHCDTKVHLETAVEGTPTPTPSKKRVRKPRKKKPDNDDQPVAPSAPKAKRAPSKYAQFVKDNYSKVRDLPSKERFKKIAEMWRASKTSPASSRSAPSASASASASSSSSSSASASSSS